MADPSGQPSPWFGANSVPDWYSTSLYSPNLSMPMPALSTALGGSAPRSGGAGTLGAPPLDQAAAVGAGGNGALGQAMGAAPGDVGAINAALQGIDPASTAGGASSGDGYNGSVDNALDFGKALLSGLSVVTGGLPGMIGLQLGAINGFKNGTGLAPNLLAMLGLTGSRGADQAGGLSGGALDMNQAGGFGAGNLAGLSGGIGGISGGLGDITGGAGDRMGGGASQGGRDRGSQGDQTAEARGFAGGGALNMTIRRRRR